MKVIRVLILGTLVLTPAFSAESADAPSLVFEEFGFQFDAPTTGNWTQLDATTMGDAALAFERVEPFALFMIYVSDFRRFEAPPPKDLQRQLVIQRLKSVTTTLQLTAEDQHRLNDLAGLRLQFQAELRGDPGRIIMWILESGRLVYELLFIRPRALGPAAAAIEADGMYRRFALLDSDSSEMTETAPQQGAEDP